MKQTNLAALLGLILACAACEKRETYLNTFDEEVVITEHERVFSDKEMPLGHIVSLQPQTAY